MNSRSGHDANGILHRITVQGVTGRPLWRLFKTPQKEGRASNQFIAVLSHELRDCLGGIRCAAGILGMDVSAGPNVVKARALIERQVDNMSRLVEDLMDVAQIANGQLRLRPERVDLCALVSQSVQCVELVMLQQDHRLTTSFPGMPIWILADATRLEQVFVNLLINAAKYTAPHGRVEVAVEQRAGEAMVSVRDTGVGIAADVLPHIFELFVQEHHGSKRAVAGLGIGLSLVRSLVEGHGGKVTATSAGLGKGSEFTVRLPLPELSHSFAS